MDPSDFRCPCGDPLDCESDPFCFDCMACLPAELRRDIRHLVDQDLQRDLSPGEEAYLKGLFARAEQHLEGVFSGAVTYSPPARPGTPSVN
jgi:hypothetical protein